MTTASKDDKKDKKIDLSLNPPIAEAQMALAFMAGEIKYGTFNYTKGHNARQLLAAIKRHVNKLLEGEDYDQECTERTGHQVSHLGCILANCAMYLHQQQLGTLHDDRFQPEDV